tara:strand:- start:399 stop:731 length:333 start_codon:yes stop_codon:yes gene_type:complete
MTTYIVLHDGTCTTITSELASPINCWWRNANRREHENYLWELQNIICEDFVKQGLWTCEGEFVISDVIEVVEKGCFLAFENEFRSLGLSFTFDPENWEVKAGIKTALNRA